MNTFWQDLRFGTRLLAKNPGFTLIAVLTLGLGIGANTAIFSLVHTVLLKPLAFANPDELVMVWEDASFANFPLNTPAPANYADWKAQNQVFEDMAATEERSFNITGDGEPERVSAYGVTENFFPLLGVQPALGRVFTTEDDRPEASPVVILSHGLWQRRYGGEPSILNRDILLNGQSFTVIGVMPAGFQFRDRLISMWVPIAFTAEDLANRGGHYLAVLARLKKGVTLTEAQADMKTVMARIAQDNPNETANGRLGVVVQSLREQLTGDVSQLLVVLLVAVGFVLLIACANIASLLLSRAINRQREIAVRAALGANRWRIARQLLTESLLLAGAGSLVGLVLAWWSFNFLSRLIPQGIALTSNLQLDRQALGFTLVVALATGILFGLIPALQASKVDLNEMLKQSVGRAGTSARSHRLRSALVIGEVALAFVLLVGAGLLIQTFLKLYNQYAGLEPESVLSLRTVLPRNKYPDHQRRTNFYDQVLARVSALPGVTSVAYTTSVPLAWKGGTSGFYPEGQSEPDASLSYDANHRQISADYFKAVGIPIKQGRHFDAGDNLQSLPVVIINETMARQFWPNENALGKRFKLNGPDSPTPWMTIVGIVADVRQMGVDVPVKAEMYMPYQQVRTQPWFAPRDMVVRTAGEPMSLVAAIRNEIRAVDAEQPISTVMTLDEVLEEEVAARRIGMILLTTFAGLALLLASLGIYGVIYYFVLQHTQELGVRMALGAQPRDILGLVLKKGMRLTLAGVGLGLLSAVALTRWMASLLYEVRAYDPLTFAALALFLTGVAFLACWLPARRAMKTDPMTALRYE